jgi:hypothetical protein
MDGNKMDQMIVWTFVHRELTRRGYVRRPSEDEFYANGGSYGNRGWNLFGRLWSGPRRGR